MTKQEKETWTFVGLILLFIWLLKRRHDEETSVNITYDNGSAEVYETCKYMDGAVYQWPVSRGPCPLVHSGYPRIPSTF